MQIRSRRRLIALVPAGVSAALVLTACGSNGASTAVAQAPAAEAQSSERAAQAPSAAESGTQVASAPASKAATSPVAAPAAKAAPAAARPFEAVKAKSESEKAATRSTQPGRASVVAAHPAVAAADTSQDDANARIAQEKNGATDVGVTKDSIKLGTINMHGLPLGNIFINQIVGAIKAATASMNDRGGILGRRMDLVDCDDGPGEVSRTKACVKKLVSDDKIFSFIGITSWGSASIHDDLRLYRMPAFGQWAYSQTEWQDPYMFPTHMSMIHEAMAGANWVRNVIKPKTYGLICLNSPEMQLACDQVRQILDKSGSTLVKKIDVAISETSMSSYVLAMRAANPEHVIHYVVNPATIAKFFVEAGQQGYWPPKGISGNHLVAELIGSVIGNWPAGRYWMNTTYKLWGSEFMATTHKYSAVNRGANHHIAQAVYEGAEIFGQAARAAGPNLTRERIMAAAANGAVYNSEAGMDQKFSYVPSERNGDHWSHDMIQGREFMYKYTSPNTVANADGSPNGFEPDPDQFVIYTWK